MPMPIRPSLSLAVLGQIDSGKSTIVGHLRYLCGYVPENEMDKLAQQAADAGKASFKFAWLCDKLFDERERGITIECTESQLTTPKLDIGIMDTPGHKSFVKKSITGAATTDHAVLVVDACDGSYEIGMTEDGTTKEHALIAFAMGAKQLIVVVNKMDALAMPYAQERFDQITSEVGAYLAKLGFKDADIQYVPVSGYVGENLVTKSTLMPWYSGVTLLEAFDSLTPPPRAEDKPFRMPVEAAFHVGSIGLVITGRVQTGVLKRGMLVSFGPHLPKGTINWIEFQGTKVTEAYPGMAVNINLKGVTRHEIKRGFVASDARCDETHDATSFTAQLVFLKAPASGVRVGYAPIVHCHANQTACQIREITAKLDRVTGEIVERPASVNEPLIVQAGEACHIVFEPAKRMAVEAFREYPSLGRIVVRDSGRTIAVGIVKSITKNGAWKP